MLQLRFTGLLIYVALLGACAPRKASENTLWRVIKQYGDSTVFFTSASAITIPGPAFKLTKVKQTVLPVSVKDTISMQSTLNKSFSRFMLHIGNISLYTDINQLTGKAVFIGYREGDTESQFRYDSMGTLETYQYFESIAYAAAPETIGHKVLDNKTYYYAYSGYGAKDKGGNEKDKQSIRELAMALGDICNKLNLVYAQQCPPVELKLTYNESALKHALDSVMLSGKMRISHPTHFYIHVEVSPPSTPVIYCRNSDGSPMNQSAEKVIRDVAFHQITFNTPSFHCLYCPAKTRLTIELNDGKVQAIHQ